MRKYVNQSATSIGGCQVETGLTQFTCTQGNACYSCQSVPICKKLLNYLGGPGSSEAAPLVDGIINFSNQYTQLNYSYSTYFSTLSNISTSNIGQSISTLSGAVSTISNISAEMPQNPIFPLPNNINIANLYSQCMGYSAANQPWYCVDIGNCESLSFNSTLLLEIQSVVAQLQASPLSSTGMRSVSANSSKLANSYVMAVVSKEDNATFSAFLNSTEPQYNSLVQKSQSLLVLYSNTMLSTSLRGLQGAFTNITKAGAGQNITKANTLLANALKSTNAAYSAAYASFSPVYSLVQRNDYVLAIDQISYAHVPAGIAEAALDQQAIDARLSSSVNSSQLSLITSELKSVEGSAGISVPLTLGSAAKAIDGGIVGALLSGAAPLGSKDFGAAAYSALISLVLGIVLVLLFHRLVYANLKHKHRIREHKRVMRAWHMLFMALGILVVLYAIVTFSAASSANTLLPASGFIGAVNAGKDVVILLNTTSAGSLACASSVQASLQGAGKKVYVIGISNGTCASFNSTFSGQCLGRVAGSMPVVLISGGSPGIVYKGMYGHVLYASGSAASGASCPLDVLFSETK
jgi:hypothetical protein